MSKRQVRSKADCTIDSRVADRYISRDGGSIAEAMKAAAAFREAQNHQYKDLELVRKVYPTTKKRK